MAEAASTYIPFRTNTRLTPENWINAAEKQLISGGIESVKIAALAEDLSVTRGSFYWHFRDTEHLFEALLAKWQARSVTMFESLLLGAQASGMEEFIRLVHLWVDESDFDPALESAMRDWGRTSPRVKAVVKDVDERRINFIKRIFLDFGYEEREAFIRARITYFHQVGYYTIGLDETLEERMELLPTYVYILTGKLNPEAIAEYI